MLLICHRIYEAAPTLGIRVVRLQSLQPPREQQRSHTSSRDSPDASNDPSSDTESSDEPSSDQDHHMPFAAIEAVSAAEREATCRPSFVRASTWGALKESIRNIGGSTTERGKPGTAGHSPGGGRGGENDRVIMRDSSGDVSSARYPPGRSASADVPSKSPADARHSQATAASPCGVTCPPGREGTHLAQSRILWLAGNYPEHAVEEGLPLDDSEEERDGTRYVYATQRPVACDDSMWL